jgi:hypothetical protein
MKECHDLSSEKTRVRGGQTTLMYDKNHHTNQMWKHHNTNVISTSQERTKQNKYFYHKSIWERRIETESFQSQPNANSSFQKQTKKQKANAAEQWRYNAETGPVRTVRC